MSNEEIYQYLQSHYIKEDVRIFCEMMADVYKLKFTKWDHKEPCEDEYDMHWWYSAYLKSL